MKTDDFSLLNDFISQTISRSCFDDPRYKEIYLSLHNGDFSSDELNDSYLQRYLTIIKKYSFEDFLKLASVPVLVSLTTFPARIDKIHGALDSIIKQAFKPDRIVVCLTKEEFPDQQIPGKIQDYFVENNIEILWGDVNLKPHNKYYYSMQSYPDDIVITIDDDIVYDDRSLEYLYLSYLEYPYYVSALRAHIISLDDNKRFLPYLEWIMNTDMLIHKPCMELLATGVGGVLYPPHILSDMLFDCEIIKETCLNADDLWLKTIQLISDVPVVLAHQYSKYCSVEGTQIITLYHDNNYQSGNDAQLTRIKKKIDTLYGTDYLENKISDDFSPYVYGVYKIANAVKAISETNAKYAIKIENLTKEKRQLQKQLKDFKNSKYYKIWRKARKIIKGK